MYASGTCCGYFQHERVAGSCRCSQKEQALKGFREHHKTPPPHQIADQPFPFDEKNETLLLTAEVTVLPIALGRIRENAEKAVRVAITAIAQIVTALKERKLGLSKPISIQPQSKFIQQVRNLTLSSQTLTCLMSSSLHHRGI